MTAPNDARLRRRLGEIEAEIVARRPEHAIEPSLDRITALTALLGDPQRAYPVIHITGTNGKTSTARMAETLLRARGLRTGLFTSPHLTSMQERICVDGVPLAADRFIEAYDEILPYLQLVDDSEPVRLSFFEVLVGMAFSVFADAPVDVAVIEVGMGGTWDNTNVADGAVAIVTPISIDHARHLGSTVEAIAADKSGIIKPGAIAVLARQPAGAERGAAPPGRGGGRDRGQRGHRVRRDQPVPGRRRPAAVGPRPARRLRRAVPAAVRRAPGRQCGLRAGRGRGVLRHCTLGPGGPGRADLPEGVAALPLPGPLGTDLVREAFGMMSSPGRLEVVRRSPLMIIDAAHNPAGMAASVGALTEVFDHTDLVAIVAVSEDKDVPGILDQLEPVAAQLVVTRNSSARSMDPAKLAELAGAVFGPDRVTVAARLDEAIEAAVALADDAAAARADHGGAAPGGPAILITGSVITAGDARLLLDPAAGAISGPPGGDG